MFDTVCRVCTYGLSCDSETPAAFVPKRLLHSYRSWETQVSSLPDHSVTLSTPEELHKAFQLQHDLDDSGGVTQRHGDPLAFRGHCGSSRFRRVTVSRAADSPLAPPAPERHPRAQIWLSHYPGCTCV
ncbi:hypothetical protein AAFF_G00275720 [Aldrovandia affinis]|uniref:Uncharacterized protein n=1 Tax=Aldrovandia affinis TaxID=143900 RepID=A0AAD7RAW3_9TELE|nr:hypothetical protein AAFF_G00275720 [Aldrovandia affinis]